MDGVRPLFQLAPLRRRISVLPRWLVSLSLRASEVVVPYRDPSILVRFGSVRRGGGGGGGKTWPRLGDGRRVPSDEFDCEDGVRVSPGLTLMPLLGGGGGGLPAEL